jgi:hypothetical protein
MRVHDIHSNEKFPTFVGHDNSNINNGNLKNPLIIEIEVVHNDAYVTKMHLENLQKQRLLWKSHYCTSVTWAFF